MIDEFNADRTGWARFSADERFRYRLARSLVPGVALRIGLDDRVTLAIEEARRGIVRVVFVLCNPSTANAFKPDKTVSKCRAFAERWGAHVLEVVNPYALRSPYPTDLDVALKAGLSLGTDGVADAAIIAACTGATRVIAGWGNNGTRIDRAAGVRRLLADNGIELEHLGLTKDGHPTHPLARGKRFIPLDREPVRWAP